MTKKNHKTKISTMTLAASFSAILATIKLIGFLYSGSLIVLASCFDSLADTATSLINNFIYKKSLARADKEHPFGHGGFEVIGALTQGLLIMFFSANVFIESLRKLFTSSYNSLERDSLPFAVGVMLFSSIGSLSIHLFFKFHLQNMQKRRERSLIILADNAHYSGDFLTNLLGAGGILLVYFSNLQFLDPLLGCISGLLLGSVALPILRKSFNDILHNEAPDEFQQIIVNIVMSVNKQIKGIHLLRSREFGPYLFVDFHMKLPDEITLMEAHKIGENVEFEIKKVFPNADLLIHLDPESEPDQKYWKPSYTIPKEES